MTNNTGNPTNTTLTIPLQVVEWNGMRCFRLVFYGVISLASLLGNCIVIKSINNIPYRKPLTYHMVSSLAVAELIGTLVLPFIQIYDELNTWPFGELMCQLTSPAQISSCLVVTWTLAIISVHRFRTIVQQNRAIYLKNTPFFVASMWVIAVIITFPSFLYSTLVKSPYDDRSYWCIVLFPGETIASFPSPMYKRYLMVRFTINFMVPMLIMFLAYGAIGIKLKYHMSTIRNVDGLTPSPEPSAPQTIQTSADEISMATIKRDENTAQSNVKADETSSSLVILVNINKRNDSLDMCTTSQANLANVLLELEQDLLKMIYIIVIVFVLFYIPYQVFFLLEYFEVISSGNWKYLHIARKYIFLITCLPSALHPLCYGTMSKFYAKVFRGIVLCRWTDHFNG
ncbi:hypothetical protein QZH41_001155 [Actinostola sp. cb2023]|nr:hypothetical protein QZH41_001155 [Actinostola sp. cb2023]